MTKKRNPITVARPAEDGFSVADAAARIRAERTYTAVVTLTVRADTRSDAAEKLGVLLARLHMGRAVPASKDVTAAVLHAIIPGGAA